MVQVVFAAGERRERELLRKAAISHGTVTLAGLARDGQEAVQMAVRYRPDVVVLTDDLKVLDGYEAACLISAAAPGVKPVLVIPEETPDSLRRAMQAGVRECVGRPISPGVLMETALQVAGRDAIRDRPEYQSALDPERFPRIVAVTGAKGGVGKTSLAVNLAVALARARRGPTCMVDLYTQYGDVGTMLNVHARTTLVDLARREDEIDHDLILAAMVGHPSGLRVLLGARDLQALDALGVERLEQVFAALRMHHRFIVVDVPPVLHAGTLHVLENAHLALLVCNLQDLTTVTDTHRLVESIRNSFVPEERLRLVLNRVSPRNQLAVDLVEKSVGIKTWFQVPEGQQIVTDCTNRGTPFVLEAPGHPVSQAVLRIARATIDNAGNGQSSTGKGAKRLPLFGFLSRNFG